MHGCNHTFTLYAKKYMFTIKLITTTIKVPVKNYKMQSYWGTLYIKLHRSSYKMCIRDRAYVEGSVASENLVGIEYSNIRD